MKLFQDTTSLTQLRRLYDAQGRPLYDARGRPLYGSSNNNLDLLRYDYGTVHFYGVADAKKTCDYTREGQTVTEDTTAFEDNAASYGTVTTSSDLRIDAADGWTGSFADAKSQANARLDELMAKANANEIDLLQWIEAGKCSLRAAPADIYGGSPIANYGQYASASLYIRERADAGISTDSLGNVTSAEATADVSDRRTACAMLWSFPCCAPGCKLKITVKSSARVSCRYLPAFRGDDVYPDLTPDAYVIKAYPVAADWTNALDAAIPLDRYNVQDIAVPFPAGFANRASTSSTSWESEIQLTVPPSRILVAVIDPTQFLPWIDSAVRAFPGYERKPSTRSDDFLRSRTCDIYLRCGPANATSAYRNAVPVAP